MSVISSEAGVDTTPCQTPERSKTNHSCAPPYPAQVRTQSYPSVSTTI